MTLIVHSPDDYGFDEWLLASVNAANGYLVLDTGLNYGEATSPVIGYEQSENYHADWTKIVRLDWAARNEDGLTVTYRVGATAAEVAAASYSALTHNLSLPSANQKRYCQIKFVFNRNDDGTSPEITLLTVVAHFLDNAGLNHSPIGARGTKDGRFKGRKYTCSICGLSGRRPEMIRQKGRLVHIICKDEDNGERRRVS